MTIWERTMETKRVTPLMPNQLSESNQTLASNFAFKSIKFILSPSRIDHEESANQVEVRADIYCFSIENKTL